MLGWGNVHSKWPFHVSRRYFANFGVLQNASPSRVWNHQSQREPRVSKIPFRFVIFTVMPTFPDGFYVQSRWFVVPNLELKTKIPTCFTNLQNLTQAWFNNHENEVPAPWNVDSLSVWYIIPPGMAGFCGPITPCPLARAIMSYSDFVQKSTSLQKSVANSPIRFFWENPRQYFQSLLSWGRILKVWKKSLRQISKY